MAHRGSTGIALLFHNHSTRRGEGSASYPGRSLPPGKTWYPLYRRLAGPQGLSGQVRIISPPSGFDPRAVQPVASRYTVYANWLTIIITIKRRRTARTRPENEETTNHSWTASPKGRCRSFVCSQKTEEKA
jgi:hypothetical protein